MQINPISTLVSHRHIEKQSWKDPSSLLQDNEPEGTETPFPGAERQQENLMDPGKQPQEPRGPGRFTWYRHGSKKQGTAGGASRMAHQLLISAAGST